MEELLRHPQTIRVLLALVEHGPLNQRAFEFYGRMSPTKGRELRDWLDAHGLVSVDNQPERRTTRDIRISLTKDGQELLRLARQIERHLDQSAKNRAKRAVKD